MKRDIKLYWTLFSSTLFLSAFTFGGGYVIVPLIASAGLSILLTALWGSENPESWIQDFQVIPFLLFGGAFLALRKFKLSPIVVMLGCGGAGIALHLCGLM